MDDHARFVPGVAALHALEQMEPRRTVAPGARLTVAAFNAERLKNVGATGALIDVAGAQATLLSEVDCGMARSGNRHAIRDLAGSRREGYVYGVEFVELDLGDPWEMRRHAGERKRAAFTATASSPACASAMRTSFRWRRPADGSRAGRGLNAGSAGGWRWPPGWPIGPSLFGSSRCTWKAIRVPPTGRPRSVA